MAVATCATRFDLLVRVVCVVWPPHKVVNQVPRMQVIFLRASPVNNFALKKWSLGPKNVLERRAWQFYTICDKNRGLKAKIDKVTAILVLRSAAGQLQVTSGFST